MMQLKTVWKSVGFVLGVAFAGGLLAGEEPGVEHRVVIKDYKFIPAEITVKKGARITWVNQEKRQYHSVWFEKAGDPEAEYFFPDETYERDFPATGSFPYRCGPHPEMTGVVTVIE